MSENNHTFSIISILIIVGVILFSYYFYFFKVRTEVPSVQEMRSKIISQSVLKFSVPTGFTNLKKEELPKDLQILIPDSPRKISILRLEDGSTKPSYKMIFEINENMHEYYFNLRQSLVEKSWNEILSKRSDLVSIFEFENDLYQFRLETEFITNEKITSKNLEQISTESKESRVVILIKSK